MSRSGYTDDYMGWDLIRWRGAVASAIRGKRGQGFLREMLAAMDSLPQPRLIAHELVTEAGECCAIGSVALRRGMDVSAIDDTEREEVAAAFGIAEAMAAEIAFVNDEAAWGPPETPEARFTRVRSWIVSNLAAPAEDAASGEASRENARKGE